MLKMFKKEVTINETSVTFSSVDYGTGDWDWLVAKVHPVLLSKGMGMLAIPIFCS